MNKKFLNITSWIAGTGIVLGSAIYGGAKYIAWEQIKEDRAVKADTSIINEQRRQSELIISILKKVDNIEQDKNYLMGGYKAMDKSYTRHLEKSLKDKDELLQYKDEQIQELKKKDYYFWIPSKQDTIPSDIVLNGRE